MYDSDLSKAASDILGAAHAKCPRLEAFSGDAGYRGAAANFVENTLGLKLHISKK